MLADERAVCRAPSFALLMITLSCETHGGASFGSLKSVKRHGDENCAKVIKLVKAECPKPMSCALCVDDAAMENFKEVCEEFIRHAGNKLDSSRTLRLGPSFLGERSASQADVVRAQSFSLN